MSITKFTCLFAMLGLTCLAPTAKGVTLVSSVQPYVAQTGWVSTDTRNTGVNATTQALVDTRVQFTAGPAGSNGSVNLITPASNDKATVAYVDTNGLGGLSGFTASYRWLKTSVGAAAPALKLGLQTTQYPAAASARIGENNWDKVLVYEPYGNSVGNPPDNVWVTESITAATGKWSLFDRNTSTSHQLPLNGLTITQWFSDATYGALLTGAEIVDVQVGQGSGNPGTDGYVDWMQTSVLNGGELVDFVAIPEPASLALAGSAALGLFVVRRRRLSV